MIDIYNLIDIPGFEGYKILISENKVASFRENKQKGIIYLKPQIQKYGHIRFSLYKNGKITVKGIHQLVMLIKEGPCPEGMEVCHNDGNPVNNHPDNLRYDTRGNNVRDAINHGYRTPFQIKKPQYTKGKFGKLHPSAKKIMQLSKDGFIIRIWESIIECSKELNISKTGISNCLRGIQKTSGGFSFTFITGVEKEEPTKSYTGTIVKVTMPDGTECEASIL